MFAYRHDKLTSFATLLQSGVADEAAAIARLEAMAAKLSPDGPAFIIYTSGTTGHPKGALCSHGRHLAGTYNIVEHYPLLAEPQRTVVYLPLSHGLGRDVAITLPLICGLVPHFGEDVEELGTTLFEVAPTVLFTVPRYLQKFASRVLVALMDSSALKRRAYHMAMAIGRRYARGRWVGRTRALDDALYALARTLVFRPILNKLGLDELRLVMCAGAPLPVETAALWQIWGVNLCEAYGQTEEAGAIISGQRGPFPRPGDVGTLAPGWELRIAETGEIQLRGDYVFEEYLGQPQATREVRGEDGWLRTGDIGEWRDGRLRLLDRARDFIVTAGGKTLSPSYIENILRASPYIAEAAVFGHARKYLTALVEIDFDTVSDWARAQNIPYSGFTSLARHPQVEALLKNELERANAQLARVEQIKAFRILPKALDPEEEGEPITPTRKVKRQQMYERFRELVDSMYDRSEEELLAKEAGTVLQH
jgi:long-chain acyl-CoA synthetase